MDSPDPPDDAQVLHPATDASYTLFWHTDAIEHTTTTQHLIHHWPPDRANIARKRV